MAETNRPMDPSRPPRMAPSESLRTHLRRSSRPPTHQIRTHATRNRPSRLPAMMQPCLDCGRPSDGARCPHHQRGYDATRYRKQTGDRKSKGGRPQYAGGWAKVSALVRATATTCWLCGQGPRRDDPWQADHVLPAATHAGTGPIKPAHRSCNVARSNRERNKQTNTTTTRQPTRQTTHDH